MGNNILNISINKKISKEQIDAILDIIPFVDYGFDIETRIKEIRKNKKYPFYKHLDAENKLFISFIVDKNGMDVIEIDDFIKDCVEAGFLRKKDNLEKNLDSYPLYCEMMNRFIFKAFKSKYLIGIVLGFETSSKKHVKFVEEYKDYFANCSVDIDYSDDEFIEGLSEAKIKKLFK